MSSDISKDEVEKIVVKQLEKPKEKVIIIKKCICVESRNISCPLHK